MITRCDCHKQVDPTCVEKFMGCYGCLTNYYPVCRCNEKTYGNECEALAHGKCLLDQWYQRKYQNEPIVFRVINDNQAYTTFFGCTNVGSLAAIDFSKNSLLIGTKADYGQFINTPVNIRQITQALVAGTNGNYSLQVKVTGEASKNAQGGEWFAFTSVVPKITSTVNLDIQYQFN
ncbi:hypothetical protein GO755_40040 [Spirosoma sp. HMF4905]|uniref:Uncharacterized protein n=1 Tax=Spirosoma arboris TaxID=2682092 RepID=A0A7K1SR48_9BACT|nr:hypothetical protein [Spirosoma arboris]MVM36268.1 hypothetical protein [Spirosoma arboris]